MQKRGLAIQIVARELASLNIGDKIPTITEFCEQKGISRGSVQYALDTLKGLQAIDIKPRGHLGTFIENVNCIKLAGICDAGSLVGVMPLPYTKRYEGLAAGLYSSLNTDEISSNIAFMRGSGNRLQQLMAGRYHFAVMSRLAFDEYIGRKYPIRAVVNFGLRSYVERHVVIVRKDFDGKWEGKLIGVDDSSFDQKSLTLGYFSNKKVSYFPLVYNQILTCLRNKQIDAGVWNKDDVGREVHDIETLELANPSIETKDTEAVVVCRDDDAISIRLIEKLINVEKIRTEQKEVISGERVPRY
jgi:hypothetical protein